MSHNDIYPNKASENVGRIFPTVESISLEILSKALQDSAPKEDVERVLGDRYNAGKDRWDLLPERALNELVRVYTFGAKKYADRNWEKGLSFMGCIASLRRHTFAFICGQQRDPESGLHHMAHAAFNCLALVEFFYTGKGKDDRPYTE